MDQFVAEKHQFICILWLNYEGHTCINGGQVEGVLKTLEAAAIRFMLHTTGENRQTAGLTSEFSGESNAHALIAHAIRISFVGYDVYLHPRYISKNNFKL